MRCCQNAAYVFCIFGIREQVIRSVERHETLWMPSRLEDQGGIFYPYNRVHGRVEDQQGPAERLDALRLPRPLQILEKLPAHKKRSPADRHFGLTLCPNLLHRLAQQVLHMPGIRRGANRRDGRDAVDFMRSLYDRRPSQRVAYEDTGRTDLTL